MPAAFEVSPVRKYKHAPGIPFARGPKGPQTKAPELDPSLPDHEQFAQLSGKHALQHLLKVLSYPIPGSLRRSLALETVLEKLQARAWQAYGLDRDTTVNVTVQTMSSIADSYDPKRITECITDVQTVDVQAHASDAQSEADGSGI